jgi:hypothetical protein
VKPALDVRAAAQLCGRIDLGITSEEKLDERIDVRAVVRDRLWLEIATARF